jgi:hypothetical protein
MAADGDFYVAVDTSTVPTRRYAQQTPEALGERAASALARAGLVADRPGPP